MVFAYVPATGTAGINTQLFIFAFLPEPFLLRCKEAGFLTQNPANRGSRKPETATQTQVLHFCMSCCVSKGISCTRKVLLGA